ncbi:hypothetical protein BAUCODRAFT_62741 [Baudoinia panamericana UAMH 10762]|uniref:CRAL-TRIO domain-containing protein n=1 Tax=Baudoinia panamericana (strain UAMH 10762) TaxID=717646 RepID=M2NM81_BAUPA|nr:uncharacterized protein BAUCODRAFT_62741 [Baudoinia panamericana UAMH 10762]EMD00286.1 hypothetical protein BAUCODRAFT_62741 [Baudoinia panamericana UAMH 10762]
MLQWPAGHIGHLTQHQIDALGNFKKLCEQKGYYTPASEDGKVPSSHDDETLLRYIRARKWIPQEAFVQFRETEDWRIENQLDTLYETIDVDEYEQTRRLYPQWTGRRDKRGIPLYVYEVSQVDSKDVNAHASGKDAKHAKQATTATTPRHLLRLFALYENLCRFVLPLCSALPNRPHGESPISQSNNIVDISKVGFAKFWSLRNHMGDASKLASAHYPETLDRIFVIGAPSFFPTVWEWAKKWFDPITVSKIFILSDKTMFETLSKYVDVDNIPKKYGGRLDWQFGDRPFLEPAIADNLRWKEDVREKGHRTLPKGPVRWQYDDKGDLVATAIGTEHGKRRALVIAGLHPEAGVARLALSPGRVNANPQVGSLHASSQPSSRTGAYTVPYTDIDQDIASPPTDSRQGTSSTRFEQQNNTHAQGQMAHGTPDYKVDGRGERQGIMEPNTVGQAPKEHPMKYPQPGDGEGQQPSMMEQAQSYATQAVEQVQGLSGSVLVAVGMGEKKEEVAAPKEVKPDDPRVDDMPAKNVEEFLRYKAMSQPQPPGK